MITRATRDTCPVERTPVWVVVLLGLLVLAGVVALQLLDDAQDPIPRTNPPVVRSR